MRAYIQCNNKGLPADYDFFNAYSGFTEMGIETVFFADYEQLSASEKCDVVVGYTGPVQVRLRDFGIEIPDIDYPDSISSYLGRKIRKSTINTVANSPDELNVFVKPVHNKAFKGRAVISAKDLIGCGTCDNDTEVYVSDIVNFVSEYRAFVRYGEILDIRHYGGSWDIFPDPKVIKNCINSFTYSPKAYAADFGITDDGITLLIEINATCSIGSYGLNVVQYAKFCSARWAELTGTTDECAFDIF